MKKGAGNNTKRITPKTAYGIESIFPIWKNPVNPVDPDLQQLEIKKRLEEARESIRKWNGNPSDAPSVEFWRRLSNDLLSLANHLKPLKKKSRTLKEALEIIEKYRKRLSISGELVRLSEKLSQLPKDKLRDTFEEAMMEHLTEKTGEQTQFIQVMRDYRKHILSGERWNKDFQKRFQPFRNIILTNGERRDMKTEILYLLVIHSGRRNLVPAMDFLKEAGVLSGSLIKIALREEHLRAKRREYERAKKKSQRIKMSKN